METALFDYPLPESAIAQLPTQRREESRLLVVDRETRMISHHHFYDLPDILPEGIHFFRNNVSVLKARIYAKRPTGGNVECLLLRPTENSLEWWVLLKPGRKLPVGSTFHIENIFSAQVLEKKDSGEFLVRFTLLKHDNVIALSDAFGQMPLPPYIERQMKDERENLDESRYNTVYSDPKQKVAAAAPTAGLHFSNSVIENLISKNHQFHNLALHIGLGTFQPIKSEKIEEHEIHTEFYEIPASTQKALEDNPGKRLAIGTTSMRAIEDFYRKRTHSQKDAFLSEANIFIYPPETFQGIDHLITNFHLPKSTLLCLISAFLTPGSTEGIKWVKEIYAEALKNDYRFFSYGDAMLIL